ncbi:S8 family serine peptidase [Trichocoleus desertorum AS-A10]|uniref:S8 family serine peptidase n=1 Tax=Trichocoleus desertorum TaxID=1481672 RepID=UPI003299B95D
MRLFNRSAKRRAAQGFAAPNNVQRAQTQTFILEPILTPSGLVDGGDETPDLAVLDADAAYSTDSGIVNINLDAGSTAPSDAELATDGDSFQEPIPNDTSSTLNMDVDGELGEGIEDFPDFDMGDEEIEPIAFIYQADFEPTESPVDLEENIESFNLSSNSPLDSTEFDIEADVKTELSLDADDAAQSDIDAEVSEQNIDPTTVTDAEQTAEELPEGEASTDVEIELTVLEEAPPRVRFDSGVFTVGETGEVGIDFLFDGGSYKGELAVFSLDGMEQFEPGSEAFIQEAARRALSDSDLGHVVIRDRLEAAKFSGSLGESTNWNMGEYLGVKTFTMRPGDEFGIMLAPNGQVQTVFDNPAVHGAKLPLFSMSTANPDDAFHVGQAVDVTGEGNTFVMEDQRVDKGSDRDYNDLIFQIRGATGKAASLDEYIAPAKDWRPSDMGQALIEYAKPYITPDNSIAPSLIIPALEGPEPVLSTADPTVLDTAGPYSDDPIDFSSTSSDPQSPELSSIAPDKSFIPTTDPNDSSILDSISTSAIGTEHFEFSKENQPLIGIIDTGFSTNNPDIDYSKIFLGRDLIDGDANPLLLSGEGNEHGTHILGIIGATQDNGVGIDGINDDAPLWVGRAVGSGKWADSLVEFVDAAKESGQPNAVVNLSLDLTQVNPDGSVTTRYEFTPAERAAIEYARQHNVLIVAAAGNDGGVMSVLGQASQEFDNIITAGAAERINGEVALSKAFDRDAYSSYGSGLDIMAPGGTVENPELSTTGDGVGAMAGTSIASAKVTGAVSQVWAANSSLSYRQVIEILKNSATDLKTPGWDGETGAGLLNIAAAVHLAKATKPEEYDVPATLIPETWSGEGRVTPTERAASTEFMGKYYEWESYTIRSGDTLSAIAYRTMGNGTVSYYNFIAQRNGIANPNLIYPGRTIQVPREVSAPAPQPQPTTPDWQRAIENEWQQTKHLLGNPTSEYKDATRSPQGTSGKYRDYENGTIHWTPQHGAVAVWIDLQREYSEYYSPSGSGGWLGFPTRREYPWNGGMRTDFEGGYIYWNGQRAKAYRSWEMPNGTQPNPQPQPIPQVPINDKSDNYRKGPVNPFAYNWIGQCTWYTYGRMLETGLLPAAIKANALFRGHAGTWKRDAERVGLPVTSTPTAGARGIVVWPPNVKGAGSVGHVAFLEEVYPDGRIRITEANWPTGSWVKERILTPAQYAGVSFVRLENAQTNSYYTPPATPGQQRQYIVRSGDTLSGIAQRELGNANRWREIQKPGGGTFTEAEARLIQPGQSVYLPVSYQSGPGTPITPVPNSKPTPAGINIISTSPVSGRGVLKANTNFRSYPWVNPSTNPTLLSANTVFTLVEYLKTNDHTYPYWYKVQLDNGQRGYLWANNVQKINFGNQLPRTGVGADEIPDINSLSLSTNSSDLATTYRIGSPTRPDIKHDDGFSKFPKESPTWNDYLLFEEWRLKANVAWTPNPWRYLPDGAAAYFHYQDGRGANRNFSYDTFVNDDANGKIALRNLILDAQSGAENLYRQIIVQYPAYASKEVQFNITSSPIVVGSDPRFPYPETENWEKAIGGHSVWLSSSVTVTPGQTPSYKLNFTLHAEDRYNFNPGQSDIASGTPDAENGRLVVVGLANEYMQYSTLEREVTWKEGDLNGATVSNGSGRR